MYRIMNKLKVVMDYAKLAKMTLAVLPMLALIPGENVVQLIVIRATVRAAQRFAITIPPKKGIVLSVRPVREQPRVAASI